MEDIQFQLEETLEMDRIERVALRQYNNAYNNFKELSQYYPDLVLKFRDLQFTEFLEKEINMLKYDIVISISASKFIDNNTGYIGTFNILWFKKYENNKILHERMEAQEIDSCSEEVLLKIRIYSISSHANQEIIKQTRYDCKTDRRYIRVSDFEETMMSIIKGITGIEPVIPVPGGLKRAAACDGEV